MFGNAADVEKPTRVRYLMLLMIFSATAISYGDRATLSITGTPMSKDLGMSAITLGYVFSTFPVFYLLFSLPGGYLLDKFGSIRVYFWAILLWSVFTTLQCTVSFFSGVWAIVALFVFRALMSAAEAPVFPGNTRITACWFPTNERNTASSIYNASQYFAVVAFTPLMAWLTHTFGWHYVFVIMGGLGFIFAYLWNKVCHSPRTHPLANKAEIDLIQAGGGLVDVDDKAFSGKTNHSQFDNIKQLLSSRSLVGVYLGQYCVYALTYFFISWFPIYLVKAKGLSLLSAGILASIPAISGFVGGILGGIWGDYLIRRNKTIGTARRVPVVVGMSLATTIVLCNYYNSITIVIFIMSLAFFGKGMGAQAWALLSDLAPKEVVGLSAALNSVIGNISAVIIPIVIGYIVAITGKFDLALVILSLHPLLAIFFFVVVGGKMDKRVVLKKECEPAASLA